MRPIGLGLAVALVVATLSPANPAFAAPAKTPAAAVSKDQHDKGMAAAPDLIAAGKYDCQLADARLIGESADPKTKAKTAMYELACTGNEGLVVIKGGETLQSFTCLEAAAPRPDGKPNTTQCVLSANADPKVGLVAYIAKTGIACTPDKIRALGHSPNVTLFELVCHEAPGGYILQTSAPPRLDKPIAMNPCMGYADTGGVKCELTDRASQFSAIDRLAAKSGKPCAIKDRGFIGAAPSGKMYYEVACQDGKGYVIEAEANGAFGRAVDCVQADSIAGGCKLTDARQAKTEQAGLYTRLAKKAGFACDVTGYAPLPVNMAGKEVVELACGNRPDGGIGVFAASESQPSVVYDCAHVELKGYRCSLTKAAAAYPSLTADLKALGKASCVVSNARYVGASADQHGYVEVGCADGLQGYMIEYTLNPITPKTPIVCSEAKGISGGCILAGNKKS